MHSAVKIAQFIFEESNVEDMTPMKILKLVYMAHGWMLGLYGRRLISEDVEAWRYGPVIRELYREVKHYGADPVDAFDGRAAKVDEEEKDLMEQVCQRYKKFDGLRLSAMTHAKGTPWHEVWHKQGQVVIPNAMIRRYYERRA